VAKYNPRGSRKFKSRHDGFLIIFPGQTVSDVPGTICRKSDNLWQKK